MRRFPSRLSGALVALAMLSAPAMAAPAAHAPEPETPSPSASAPPMGRVLVGGEVPSYVPQPSVRTALMINTRTGARATLDVSFALDAPERETRRLIEQRQLWLRAALSETLLIYSGRMYRWGDVPDVELIARLMQEDVDRLLGPDRATVLLDSVLIHAG